MEIGSLSRGMAIHGTFQVNRESIECVKNFKPVGLTQESKAVRDVIGEFDMLKSGGLIRFQENSTVHPARNQVFAIDTGSQKSGYCKFEITPDGEQPYRIITHGVVDNADLVIFLLLQKDCAIVMENFQAMGMAVGKSVFDSCIWLGRFIEMARRVNDQRPVFLMHRTTVKREICGQTRAKDANVRQAIIDMFTGVEDGGKVPQIGTKKNQGPLYGVKSHVWSALAVGISLDKLMSVY